MGHCLYTSSTKPYINKQTYIGILNGLPQDQNTKEQKNLLTPVEILHNNSELLHLVNFNNINSNSIIRYFCKVVLFLILFFVFNSVQGKGTF